MQCCFLPDFCDEWCVGHFSELVGKMLFLPILFLFFFLFFLIARLCGYSHTNIWCFKVVCKISEDVFLHHVRHCLCCGGTQQRMTVYWWLNLLIHNKENRFYSAWSPWGYQNRHKGCASETSVCKITDNLLRKRRKT